MDSLTDLAACLGRWRGTNRLHDPHANAPDDSPSVLNVESVLDGRFLRCNYTWSYRNTPQQGSLLLGADPKSREITSHWIDTWHMGHQVMALRGAIEEGNKIALSGTYPAPPGPDWGWRMEIAVGDGRSIRILMFNVTPDGRSAPAVEASYTRGVDEDSISGDASGDRDVGEIGQIAITVSDVGSALRFYRDVLGLKFLFSPSPQLAFLAAGNVRIMLTTPQGAGQIGGNSILYFKVTHVEAVHQDMINRGAVSERAPRLIAKMPDHELWIGFLRDPDGNVVGLMEEKRQGA